MQITNYDNNRASVLTDALFQLDISATCIHFLNSPTNTTYHYKLTDVRKLKKAFSLEKELESIIHEKVAISISNYDNANICIAVNKSDRPPIWLAPLLDGYPFERPAQARIALFGVDNNNNKLAGQIDDMPHLLIAGATGSGKSMLMHSILCSIVKSSQPSAARLLLIDLKRVELAHYKTLPHLARPPIATAKDALAALSALCAEMDKRYKTLERKRLTQWQGAHIIVAIDEMSELMLISKKDTEKLLVRIAQLGRAAGIHLMAASQRPSANVITGLIKANIPSRIALTMASRHDSAVIEIPNAHRLAGNGDAYFQPKDHTQAPIRFQVPLSTPAMISSILRRR